MNKWDRYVFLAVRYQWTPQEVDSLDPDFLESLEAMLQAEAMNSKAKA